MNTKSKMPKALYSCNTCREDYSWPPDYLFWSEKAKGWFCLECWDAEAHGEKGASLESVLNEMKNFALCLME